MKLIFKTENVIIVKNNNVYYYFDPKTKELMGVKNFIDETIGEPING